MGLHAAAVALVDGDDLAEQVQGGLDVVGVGGNHDNRIVLAVHRHRHAVSVADASQRRRQQAQA